MSVLPEKKPEASERTLVSEGKFEGTEVSWRWIWKPKLMDQPWLLQVGSSDKIPILLLMFINYTDTPQKKKISAGKFQSWT